MERRKKRSKSESHFSKEKHKASGLNLILNNYEIYEDQKFHYRIMKRAIILDRLRRKEIISGSIKDNEYF